MNYLPSVDDMKFEQLPGLSELEPYRASVLQAQSPTFSDISSISASQHSDYSQSSSATSPSLPSSLQDLWGQLTDNPDYMMNPEEFSTLVGFGAQYPSRSTELMAKRAIARYEESQSLTASLATPDSTNLDPEMGECR